MSGRTSMTSTASSRSDGDTGTDDSVVERVCRKKACAIQFCLKRHDYQELECADVIERYYDCVTDAKRKLQAPPPSLNATAKQ